MTLPDMLSAVRTLLLDEAPPDGTTEQRRSALAKRFSQLSETEIADLAAIEPTRLTVYTDLIFAGQREQLRWVYPMSFEAMHRLAGANDTGTTGGQDDFDLMREMHRHRPWRSGSTRDLARRFQEFICETRRELMADWLGLAELLDYERTELEVFYAPDVAFEDVSSLSLTDLSVEALMEIPIFVPPFAAMREYQYDVLAIASGWSNDEGLPSPLPKPQSCLTVCGRSPQSLMPEWVRLTPEVFAALESLPDSSPATINDLASAYIEATSADGRSEQELFADLFTQLSAMFSAGVLLRPTPDAA
jgi:hypothetical protein